MLEYFKRIKYQFRGKSPLVISFSRGLQYWHFTFLLGPYSWGKKRWISYHTQWRHYANTSRDM